MPFYVWASRRLLERRFNIWPDWATGHPLNGIPTSGDSRFALRARPTFLFLSGTMYFPPLADHVNPDDVGKSALFVSVLGWHTGETVWTPGIMLFVKRPDAQDEKESLAGGFAYTKRVHSAGTVT